MNSIDQYTSQVISFALSGRDKINPLAECSTIKQAERHINLLKKSGKKNIIIFGLADLKFVSELKKNLPGDGKIIVCELSPQRVRNAEATIADLSALNIQVLCDTSMWSHVMFLEQYEFFNNNSHLILNPSLTGAEKENHQKLQKIISGAGRSELPAEKDIYPTISAAAILSPEEPALETFIDSFPIWIDELVIVWDCETMSAAPKLKSVLKTVQTAHPLKRDFAAQRNRMLKNCSGEWIIYLDADERISNQGWENIRKTIRSENTDAVYLPRKTFFPDEKHCRMGYGLWPDMQLRLFKNSKKIKFTRPVHELLTGYKHPAITTGTELRHETHLLKERDSIDKKLSFFNKVSGEKITHRFGKELPFLAEEELPGPSNIKAKLITLP
ncbi:glycosyltransferase [Maridesulfovibrio bastinii]|uniref:glycosyltransferase n=1 Tax=Maridesulfovibrio bastinii TaxID=47157 RepID=UPI000409EFB1|nr:glycosyltransferase [Maridesulfovibrio bastinii]